MAISRRALLGLLLVTAVAVAAIDVLSSTPAGPRYRSGAASVPARAGDGSVDEVLIVGDSLVNDVKAPLRRILAGDGVALTALVHPGAPLGDRAFYDWPSEVADEVERSDPDVVVVWVSTPLAESGSWVIDGHTASYDSDRWHEWTAALVDEVVTAASSKGAKVIWLTRPITDRAGYERLRPASDRASRAAVARFSNASFVDLSGVLAGPGGQFRASGPGLDGVVVPVRRSDGVHFTEAGAEVLAARIAESIER